MGRDLERAGLNLAGHVRSARERHIQNRHLWMAGAAGIVAGILLVLLLPRILPFSADTRVAGLIMGADRWNAGARMMEAESLEGWRDLRAGWQLIRDNADAIQGCQERAAQDGEAQACAVSVAAPRQ